MRRKRLLMRWLMFKFRLTARSRSLTRDAEDRKAQDRADKIEAALCAAQQDGRLTPGAVEVYRDIGRQSGPELLEQALSALTPAPLGSRQGRPQCEQKHHSSTALEHFDFLLDRLLSSLPDK